MLQHDVSSVEVQLMEVVRAADVGVIDPSVACRGARRSRLFLRMEAREEDVAPISRARSQAASSRSPPSGEAEDADTGAEALFGMGFGAQDDVDQDPGMGPVGGGPASDAFRGPIGMAAV